MELSVVKGTKDYLPEEQIGREKIKEVLVKIFRRYGFNPLETPILEPFEVLASKYAGGAEILKETYKLKDQGDRELGLRYDLTVPFSRVIGMNPQLGSPFKRYELGKVFRDGPIKTGRFREFTQCDADVVGIKSMMADAECIALMLDAFKELKMDVFVEVNNRKLLSGIIQAAGVGSFDVKTTILSIDKLKKIGVDGVKAELTDKGIDKSVFNKLFSLLTATGSSDEVLEKMSELAVNDLMKEGIAELKELFNCLKSFGAEKNVNILLSLARGLEIYTGTVFEVYAKNSFVSSSIAAGGRFDRIIGDFLGGSKEYPAVGFSFGLDVIYEVIKERFTQKSIVRLFIIPIKTALNCLEFEKKLRDADIAVDMDQIGRGISKNLEYANKQGIPFVLIVGNEELKQNKLKLRNMVSGEEKMLSLTEVIEEVRK